jgi:hypothetical protein
MKLGTNEPKKVALLGILLLAAGVLFYTNVLSQPTGDSYPAPAASPAAPQPAAPSIARAPQQAAPRRLAPNRSSSDEFHPSLRPRRPEDRVDPMSIDPTLRLDLLAKVQSADISGGSRNLFQFSAPPPPKAELNGPEPKILPKVQGPPPPPKPEETAEKAPPPPPPINLKYYGFSTVRSGDGRKTAFFLDGDEILLATEGDTLKKRYKVVRISVNSVMMEDTVSKSQQSVPIQEDPTVGGAALAGPGIG